jgi:hypothetical protein
MILHDGRVGEVYNIGGHNERTNLEVVKTILRELGKPETLITYVTDRAGHDLRYAIDPAKMMEELGWQPETRFDRHKTHSKMYLDNKAGGRTNKRRISELLRKNDAGSEWMKVLVTGETTAGLRRGQKLTPGRGKHGGGHRRFRLTMKAPCPRVGLRPHPIVHCAIHCRRQAESEKSLPQGKLGRHGQRCARQRTRGAE